MVGARQLVLTVTRACRLRCTYCPTLKLGWPELSAADAGRAVTLFADRYGGGDVKLFGGEPLMNPDAVEAALEAAADPRIRRVQLSTNGLLLDEGWLARLGSHPRSVLVISLDGRPEDHRRHRGAGSYERVLELLPVLLRTPRVVVTQTIAPEAAGAAADNFQHLLGLGFRRFNLLPAFFVPWTETQVRGLRRSLSGIEREVRRRWAAGERLHLRNLFVRAPVPFVNTGLVVDSDGSLHASNLGLAVEAARPRTRVGSLDAPPDLATLDAAAGRVPALMREVLPADALVSTLAVDAALTDLCDRLLPALLGSRGAA